MSETPVTNIELNQMNDVLFAMKQLTPRIRAPTFSIELITQAWHEQIDPETSTETIISILQSGAQIGFFLVTQDLEGALSYGYNANMLAFNPQNRFILEDSPCLSSCNRRANPTVIQVPSTPSNCCYTMPANGGSLGYCGCDNALNALALSGASCTFTSV